MEKQFLDDLQRITEENTKDAPQLGKVLRKIMADMMQILEGPTRPKSEAIADMVKSWRGDLILTSLRLSTELYNVALQHTFAE